MSTESTGAKERSRKFRARVYEIVGAIPPGRVMTYGGIATLIPAPDDIPLASYRRVRARWVGYAMRACPEGLPWHRVVNAKGRISPRVGHGPHVQRILLDEEGVNFDEQERIDLDRHQWYPSTQWSLDHDLLPPAKEGGGP